MKMFALGNVRNFPIYQVFRESDVHEKYLNWVKAKPASGHQPAQPARRALASSAHPPPFRRRTGPDEVEGHPVTELLAIFRLDPASKQYRGVQVKY